MTKKTVIGIALISALAFSANFATAADPANRAAKSEPNLPPTKIAARQKSADLAVAKIQGNKTQLDQLATAVRTKDAGKVKEMLRANGFNAEDTKVVLVDNTKGNTTARIKVHASLNCDKDGCTLTLSITI